MKTDLIARMEELLRKDAAEVATDVRALQKEYQKLWTAEFEKARHEFVEEGGKLREFEYPKQPEDVHFESLLDQYARKRKEAEARLAAEQARNLTIRQEIIAKIRDLSHLSENVGAAMRKLQELQAQWKETGQVSPHKYKEVQADYSRAVEEIYYNLKIFRDLQEHDLKRNHELKSQVIEKLKALHSAENIKEAERLIKVYRNEWEEIGPVPHGKWEALKHEYKTALDDTYARIKAFYNSLEEQKESNLKHKEEIVAKAKELVEGMHDAKPSKWNEATDKLLALQAEWKQVGRTSEKDADRVWSEFRSVCDSFFERKKEFFSGLHEKFAEVRKAKSELIAKAEALQNSTDWQKTSLELMRLQDAWKKYPGQGDKEEPKLFARFRKACNAFFDAKKEHFNQLDEAFVQNLAVKEEILERLKNFVPGDDSKANRESLKGFAAEWNAAGHVPSKDRKRVNDAFYARLDELYGQLQLDQREKALLQYSTKVERLASSDNAGELLKREADHLKRIGDEIGARIRTYDNNLGFFKSAKGSTMLQEVQEKIEGEKAKLDELNARRKLVNDELRKLAKAEKAVGAAEKTV